MPGLYTCGLNIIIFAFIIWKANIQGIDDCYAKTTFENNFHGTDVCRSAYISVMFSALQKRC